jgi:hypothetical protein
VSNIESVQQTLNLTLDAAYIHVFVLVEVLIWIRSVAIVLLIVANAMRHVSGQKRAEDIHAPALQPTQVVVTPELVETLRGYETSWCHRLHEGPAAVGPSYSVLKKLLRNSSVTRNA